MSESAARRMDASNKVRFPERVVVSLSHREAKALRAVLSAVALNRFEDAQAAFGPDANLAAQALDESLVRFATKAAAARVEGQRQLENATLRAALNRPGAVVRLQGAKYIDFDHSIALKENESREYVKTNWK